MNNSAGRIVICPKAAKAQIMRGQPNCRLERPFLEFEQHAWADDEIAKAGSRAGGEVAAFRV